MSEQRQQFAILNIFLVKREKSSSNSLAKWVGIFSKLVKTVTARTYMRAARRCASLRAYTRHSTAVVS
jgi:hypothetical protein